MTPTDQYKVDYFYSQSGLAKAESEKAQLSETRDYYNKQLTAFADWSTESIDNEAKAMLINEVLIELDKSRLHTIAYHVAQLVRRGVDIVELAKVLVTFTAKHCGEALDEDESITYYNSFHSALNALE